jgi:hypothetical protein
MPNLIVEIIEGPGSGRQLELLGPIDIGREPSVRMVLNDELASRRHARLTPAVQEAILEDLGSSNGTFVNGQEIHSTTSVRPGDQILIGVTVLQLRSAAQVAARPSAVHTVPPALAIPARVPDYLPPGLRVAGAAKHAGGVAVPELDPLLDMYTKRKARTAPLAVFALAVIVILLFLVLVVGK